MDLLLVKTSVRTPAEKYVKGKWFYLLSAMKLLAATTL